VTPPALADALGPRGRRRAAIASVAAGAVLVGLVLLAARRLADRGQLDAQRWEVLLRWDTLRFLLGGLAITVEAAGIAMVLATAIGGLMALGRLARNRPLRWLAGTYVELFRAIPLLVLILFAFFVLPDYGIDLSAFWYLVIALTAYNSAVLGEIFRAGILSLERGQTEAAYAVGLTYWQAMLGVVVPQAARRMTPAIVSQLITLLKDTSLGVAIGVQELLRRGEQAGEFARSPLQSLVIVAALYLVVNLVLSRVARRLEVRQRRRYRAGGITVTGGPEDLVVVSAEGESKVR
jgi:glutamate transport system permease protein